MKENVDAHTQVGTLHCGGFERHYLLYTPPGAGRTGPVPLVVLFHGGGGTAALALESCRWREKARQCGFVVLAPEALRRAPTRPATFLRNPQFWNAGAPIDRQHSAIDDVGFVAALLAHVRRMHPIDAARVYGVGFSNGASMAMRVGMELADEFAAVGAVAGHLWITPPAAVRPVSLVYLCGLADPMVPFRGGRVLTVWGRHVEMPPVAETVNAWAHWLGCRNAVQVLADTDDVRRVRYGPGSAGAEVEFWTLRDLGHVWPGGDPVLSERLTGPSTDRVRATDEIWAFFERHPRPA